MADEELITTSTPLVGLAEAARAAGVLALDTEFMGEGRYRALLCLVQVAVPDRGGVPRVELVDPLAEGLDPTPLVEVLADPSVDVVVHAGRQDVAILRRAWDTEVSGLFDTQVAAAFLGLGAQIGYGALVGQLTGRTPSGSATFTRWDRRPLSAEQLSYAREDVVDLLEVASILRKRLEQAGRLEWALEECREIEQVSDHRVPEEAWRQLPRVNRLSAGQRAVARELAAWRERTAREENRPLTQICADSTLVEIARRRPGNTEDLRQIRGIRHSMIRRRGDEVIEAVRRGQQAEPIPEDSGPRRPSDPADASLIAICEALVRHRVQEADLAYELVAARAELQALVAARRLGQPEPEIRVLSGWRRELVGDELLELLEGRLALVAGEGGVLEVRRA